ncbi:UNVERIFIED_CONTAM: hypothetical protein K2H54_041034 [Gekko kuhli]
MLSEKPTDARPPVPPSIPETLGSTLPVHLKSASDVSTSSKRKAPKESSSASTPAKKKEEEHEKVRFSPKEATHKSHSVSGVGKQMQWAQPNIVAPLVLELMILPPIELLDSPIQRLNPPGRRDTMAKVTVAPSVAEVVLNTNVSAMAGGIPRKIKPFTSTKIHVSSAE